MNTLWKTIKKATTLLCGICQFFLIIIIVIITYILTMIEPIVDQLSSIFGDDTIAMNMVTGYFIVLIFHVTFVEKHF